MLINRLEDGRAKGKSFKLTTLHIVPFLRRWQRHSSADSRVCSFTFTSCRRRGCHYTEILVVCSTDYDGFVVTETPSRSRTAWSWTQCSSTNRLNLLFQFMTYELSLFRSAFNKGKLISLCDGEMKINQWLFRDAFNPPAQDLHRREFSAAMENYFSISHVLRIPLIKIAF